MKKLYLCLPLYSSMVHVGVAKRFFRATSANAEVHPMISKSSLLASGFNHHWVAAHAEQFDYFIMLHGDVEPVDPMWVDILLEEMVLHEADIVSAVIPIKNDCGLTSTAIGKPDTPWIRQRLSLKQCLSLPKTFSAADVGVPEKPLLVNTGCMLVNLSKEWSGHAHFTVRDQVNHGSVECEPEDWYFSRRAWELGAKAYATTALRVQHHGEQAFTNWEEPDQCSD